MEDTVMIAAVEAVLFSSGEPVETEKICEAVGIVKKQLEEIIGKLEEKYDRTDSGIKLVKLNDSYQLTTKEDFAHFIKSALEIKKNSVLSPAAMEALTIVAYNQPVTKGFVEHVRGVDSSGVVNSLVEKGLLTEAGRLDLPGRPIAYKTTDTFLRCFQLSSLDGLPPLPDQQEQVTIEQVIENNDSENDEE
ncbi:SMC-Scp complex subunit ScpB [Ruminococcus sp.]|uniref:SMC-Scp complex subunit ScpB n=1 Tax=Ruminococcus sp. TaxID=41978 RepID=UPI002600EA07|nr:SMC-Scp complex subunit ScpB [Ruminococcus sp.]